MSHVLTVTTDGSGTETNHAAQREAAKLRANGIKVKGRSAIYTNASGQLSVDLEWEKATDKDTDVPRPETFEEKLLRISTEGTPPESVPLKEQPKSSGKARSTHTNDPDRAAVLVPSTAMRGAIDEAAGGLDADAMKEAAAEPSAKPVGSKRARKTTASAGPIRRARAKKSDK